MINSELKQKAIIAGIKTIAVGKKGTKSLLPEQIDHIHQQWSDPIIPDETKGAFIGALIIKGVTPEEMKLETLFIPGIFSNPEKLINYFSPDTNSNIKLLCAKLLSHEELNLNQSEILGDFLMSEKQGHFLRGLCASILRVRYETADEYEGLLKSIKKTYHDDFTKQTNGKNPILQIAEPFDGNDHSYAITPIIADYLKNKKYRTVTLCGRNSGPKYGNNVLDIAKHLQCKFLSNSLEVTDNQPEFGYYLDQKDLSTAMDRWVNIRQHTIKRPFMSTIERFVNPFNADICLASAFHPPYGEKMLTVCERVGFPGSIIIRNGMEGTIAFPLKRPARLLCSAKQKDGTFKRHEIIYSAEEDLDINLPVEERLDHPTLEENVRLIKDFINHKKTSNHLFDLRIQATSRGISLALDWLNENVQQFSDNKGRTV